MRPDVPIHSEVHLLASLLLADPSELADALWQDGGGVVRCHALGVDLHFRSQNGWLHYPFLRWELFGLARKLQEAEAAEQSNGGQQRSLAQHAEVLLAGSPSETEWLGAEVLGADFRMFRPHFTSRFVSWYEDSAASKLMAVVPPTEHATVADAVLAYALTWRNDRELILVLSDEHAEVGTRRLPWLDAPAITVLTPEGVPVTQDRAAVLASASALRPRPVQPLQLDAERVSWVAPLLAHPAVQSLAAQARRGYLFWHHHGLQVLRLAPAAEGGLRVKAGAPYNWPPPGHLTFDEVITGPLSDGELTLALDAIVGPVTTADPLTGHQAEHRLRERLGALLPSALGLPYLASQYPAYRGHGRPGFIDFLGCDAHGHLHVVETNVDRERNIVLRALDYGIWVHANDQAIRATHPDWPLRPAGQSQTHLNFVLAAGADSTASGRHLATQLEVLADDIKRRVFVIPDHDQT